MRIAAIAGAAKLQDFPDWYEFPNETATAGSIILTFHGKSSSSQKAWLFPQANSQ
ncbi:hypothetical protein [Nostoc sp.]|uniref:hypothetical protein n=1 Tax=Nostoc sp. TaxID=1180 RepID=UPI002FF88059